MPDIASITAIVSSLRTASDIAKILREAGQSFAKAELQLKLADLMTALAEARGETASVQEIILEKDGRIRELEEALKVKEALRYEAPYYWLMVDGNRDGPFCQNCYDKDGKLVRLQTYDNGYFECKACGNSFTTAAFRQHRDSVISEIKDYDPMQRF